MSFIPNPGEAFTYEFTEAHNEIIGGLARFMQITGVMILLYGGLETVQGVLAIRQDGWTDLVGAAVSAVIGVFTLKAASFFRRIVVSQGEDLSHLMAALETLRRLYKLQAVLYIIGVTLLILALIFITLAPKGN
jgi:hypothetical protein